MQVPEAEQATQQRSGEYYVGTNQDFVNVTIGIRGWRFSSRRFSRVLPQYVTPSKLDSRGFEE